MRSTHRHVDGGLYAFHSEMAAKHPDTDEWINGICYVGLQDGLHRWTTKERWRNRFTEIPLSEREVIDLRQTQVHEDDELICTYTYHLEQVGDLRHMLISASRRAEQVPRKDSNVINVLKTQAEMVAKGLHVRDLENLIDMMGDIVEFHQKFGQEYLGKPRSLKSEGQGDDTIFHFRSKFMQEEKDEYDREQEELDKKIDRNDEQGIAKHLELQLDALVDLTYVVLGTAYLQFGPVVFNEAWRRVHSANMKKVRAVATEEETVDSGRKKTFDVVKPKGWVAPNHLDLVEDHAHLTYTQPEQTEFMGTNQEGRDRYSDTRRV